MPGDAGDDQHERHHDEPGPPHGARRRERVRTTSPASGVDVPARPGPAAGDLAPGEHRQRVRAAGEDADERVGGARRAAAQVAGDAGELRRGVRRRRAGEAVAPAVDGAVVAHGQAGSGAAAGDDLGQRAAPARRDDVVARAEQAQLEACLPRRSGRAWRAAPARRRRATTTAPTRGRRRRAPPGGRARQLCRIVRLSARTTRPVLTSHDPPGLQRSNDRRRSPPPAGR